MNRYKLKIEKLLTVSTVITMVIIIISLYYNDFIEKNDIGKVAGVYGTITMIVGVIWWWFREHGWKHKIFQRVKSVVNIPPNLNGRWVGSFNRPEHDNTHPFVIEIEQTIDTLILNTYSRTGGSKSSVYNILTNELQSTFHLTYLWTGKTSKNSNEHFYGYTMLKLIENDKDRKLVGTYFTDRAPDQTKGKITVYWKTNKLKKEF